MAVPEPAICNLGRRGYETVWRAMAHYTDTRDGDTRASYVTWDGDTVWFHRVEYDFRKTQRKILESGGLPRYLADRLKVGR